MKPGPKPQPGEVLAFTGGRSTIARSSDSKSEEVPGEVVRPKFIKGKSRKLWDSKAPDLIARGALKSWDADTFGVWCVLMAEFQEDPAKFTSAKLSNMRMYGELFGLNGNSSRVCLNLKPAETDSKDPADEFFDNTKTS